MLRTFIFAARNFVMLVNNKGNTEGNGVNKIKLGYEHRKEDKGNNQAFC
jgi:hypothetical protein